MNGEYIQDKHVFVTLQKEAADLSFTVEQALAQESSEAFELGEGIYRRGNVRLMQRYEDHMVFAVKQTDEFLVTMDALGQIECSCDAAQKGTLCAHMIAASRYANREGLLDAANLERGMLLGRQLMSVLRQTSLRAQTIRMGIGLKVYGDGRVGLTLSVGVERLYAVPRIPALVAAVFERSDFAVTPRFTYEPENMRFSDKDQALITLLYMNCVTKDSEPVDEDGEVEQSAVERPQTDGRALILRGGLLLSVLEILRNRAFTLMVGDTKTAQSGIQTGELPLCFGVSLLAGAVEVTASGAERLITLTPDARYTVSEGKLQYLYEQQARVARLIARDGAQAKFIYPLSEASDTLGSLLPLLSSVGRVVTSQQIKSRLISCPLKVRVYLDVEEGDVLADVLFCYDQMEIRPFDDAPAQERDAHTPMLLRDGRGENQLLMFLSDSGFSVRGKKIVMRGPKDMLRFLTHGVTELSKLCEVYVSKAFEKIKPRRFNGVASFHMKNGSLVFTLLENNEPVPDLQPILQAIQQRQQYVRLKTGEFLDVRDMAALSPVAQELLDAAAIDRISTQDERELSFGSYRAGYLVRMLEQAGEKTQVDPEVDSAIRALTEGSADQTAYIPKKLLGQLESYQKRGSGWLISMYDARMGGILADEMGLGKTVQVIAALSAAKARDGAQKSIIVTPTSLIYHWQAEFKRFDDKLTVRIISGMREERRRAIAQVLPDQEVDVVLTTYPLLRRDIALLKDTTFRFAILDEAQYIKNAGSLGASAARELNAQAHIALTGTPMENHTGELWSIFDFVLPGYLGTQSAFLRRYGAGEHAKELQERIRPFMVRRLKSDVLKLPDKREHVMMAAMTPEQQKVYQQLMETLRLHVGEALKQSSLPRARMQVLSLLLKLRQVCCHPKLMLPDYEGASGKLELMTQTVLNAIASGRRILIFSQFVGMLSIIRKRLSREGMQTLYLDGSTSPQERQALCDRFNGGEGNVFLISLKAGGTGLNLTGADLVIHFDPWWNPAAEDQATDRAHRIGQTKDVDVIKLITKDSIEEKVTQLSARKRAIFDSVIRVGETALPSLTKEDIMALFF